MALTRDISNIVAGDDYELVVTVEDIPAGQTLTKAWLTVKAAEADADPGLIQKIITTADVVGTGQITDDGAVDGTGALRFDLIPANTALLVPSPPNRRPYYDVQIKTSAGKIYTPVKGRISAAAQTTLATS